MPDPAAEEHRAFLRCIDAVAGKLRRLRDARVPVLWRPFHEMNGHWFWWSKGTPEQFRALWVLMHERFTSHHRLDNLLWVWSGSYAARPECYPGDAYVDFVGSDAYLTGRRKDDEWARAERALRAVAPGKAAALIENDRIPPPEALVDRGLRFTWFLTWHSKSLGANTEQALRQVYQHAYVVTRDELPDLRSTRS